MDYNCYEQLGRGEIVSRYLNERYLLVPVRINHGVFHPKLHLMMGHNGARVICGSNNLTQAGSIHNLELFNVLHIEVSDGAPNNSLALAALGFFNHCIDLSEGTAGKIAKQWIDELAVDYVWLDSNAINPESPNEVRLVHTFGDSPWRWLVRTIGNKEPKSINIISPFYDKDFRLLRRIKRTWPRTTVKIFAQQQSSNLQGNELAKIGDVSLFHLEIPNNRRLHAKLVAVDFEDECMVLSGSCNFTSAAFDGRNVEAALSILSSNGFIDNFFPEDVKAMRINPEDFIPVCRDEPNPPVDEENVLSIWEATLNESGLLKFKYDIQITGDLQELTLVLKVPGEKEPRRSAKIPKNQKSYRDIQLTKGELSELPHAALFCRLEGIVDGKIIQSPAAWIIHEHRLTRQVGGSKGRKGREKVIRETGQGLTAYLDALGKREGKIAVIEFLQHLNIRFQGGLRPGSETTPRPPSPRDPTISQKPPKWSQQYSEEFEVAVFDFVQRHHKSILQRHARGGNLNGLENFMDVFSTCNKLIFLHCERKSLKPLHVMDWFFIGLYRLTLGGNLLVQSKEIDGFIGNVLKALSGNLQRVQKAIESFAVPEHAAFALIAAQRLHMINVREDNDITKSLPSYAQYTKDFFDKINLYPNQKQYNVVLQYYGIDNIEEQDQWWNYLSIQNLVIH
ncbi:MAG: hypothetical protein JRJ46_13395 [Deltaproteobacteria bacterium]|nr:hypothetical protein [Deltaproteobacteria bacterium]